MSIELTLVLVVSSVLAVYLYLQKQYSYWSNKKTKCIPYVPFIGSYYENVIQRKTLFRINDDIYRKHRDDKFVASYRGLTPELHVFDPELIRIILVKDFNIFPDRSFPSSEKEPITQHLFGMRGNKWKILRQKLTPTFTTAKMKQMFPLVLDNSELLLKNLNEIVKKNDIQEVREIMAEFTTDTIGSCAFGLNMNSMNDKNAVFRNTGKKIFASSRMTLLTVFLYGLMPKVIEFLRLTRYVLASVEIENFFIRFMKELVKERENSPSNRNDFVDLMLNIRKQTQENSDDFKLTDELMMAQSFVFFLAGFETSSTTMSYALYELAKNPKAQEKVLKEIDHILKKHDGQITYDSMYEMKYLQSVIDETLRKYPPIPVLDRVCNSSYKLPGTELTIDAGVDVSIPVYSLHYDEKYFPEPEKFIPERFMDDSIQTVQPFTYLPFGDGPRNCIGLRFGKLQSAVGLITVLRNYSLEMCAQSPKDIQFDVKSVVPTPIDGIRLRFKPRISQ